MEPLDVLGQITDHHLGSSNTYNGSFKEKLEKDKGEIQYYDPNGHGKKPSNTLGLVQILLLPREESTKRARA